MKHFSYKDFKDIMTRYHKTNKPDIRGVIVFSKDSFDDDYSLDSRSYSVSSNNKMFGNYGGYSLFGSALDGSDNGVRLEAYMQEEGGGARGWKVDYCYFPDGEPVFD